MIVKQKLCRRKNGKKEYYLDDTTEFHTLQEVKDFCYRAVDKIFTYDSIRLTFTIIDTNEDINIFGNWVNNGEGIHLDIDF